MIAGTNNRNKRRALEHRARQRRADRLEAMRRTNAALERAVVVAHTLGDDAAAWEDFLDDDVSRIRYYVVQSLELTKEASVLTSENAQYMRLLQEHQLATQALSALAQDYPDDDWDRDVARWHALSQQYFVPWTLEECQDIMDAALKEASAFQWNTEKQTTGARIFGWRDARRVDRVTQAMQFEFYKTFRGYAMIDYVNTLWDAFTYNKVYQQVIVGRGNLSTHEVLQQLTPNTVLVRTSSRNPDLGVDTHFVYLVFRVRTECGFTQCVQSVCSPELVNAIAEPHDVWPSNSTWMQIDGDDKAYAVRIGGTLRATDVSYAKKWLFEILECVVRSEYIATGRGLIRSE